MGKQRTYQMLRNRVFRDATKNMDTPVWVQRQQYKRLKRMYKSLNSLERREFNIMLAMQLVEEEQ